MIQRMDPQEWKQDLPAFKEKTEQFFAGEIDKGAYKGFSGLYGSYAQKGQTSSMLRLRMTAGRVTKEKLAFVAKAIRDYQVDLVHFTTCQTIQLHNLGAKAVCGIMEEALDVGIVTMGGGGDFPRNVMCSPLSGVEREEYFDVRPWAEAAADYLMTFVKAEKMPRKLKVGFSGSPKNETHVTFRDLGFAAREDGKFDVYAAGGLGNSPLFGVKVAEAVEPERILYYVKAMWLTFLAYGNYENRARARTRFMQETLGGEDACVKAYQEKLEEVLRSGEDLTVHAEEQPVRKKGNGTTAAGSRVIPQKQDGLYAVLWHPIGGLPKPETLCAVSDVLQGIEAAELRLAPDGSAYLINLTGDEAEKMLELTKDSVETLFEASVSCIGAKVCQVGIRDSQGLLSACIKAVREAGIPDGALPKIHISGCPSSCGTHQIGSIGLRGAAKRKDGKSQAGFTLYVGGEERQGRETMGRELGILLEEDIPLFFVKLGQAVAASGLTYARWAESNPEGIAELAAEYL